MGRSLAHQLVTLPDIELAGLSDTSAQALETAVDEFGAPAFESAAELLDKGLDALLIATPPFEHLPLARQAAERGLHLFVEKPMAANTADCDAMAEAARSAGVLLMVGQVLRFYPCWWQILEWAREGRLGRPVAASLTRIGAGWASWTQPWRHSRELSGGLLMEVNAHEIDFLCRLFGEPRQVYCEADRFSSDASDYPDTLFVTIRFADGGIGQLHSSNFSAVADLSGRVQGTGGSAVYDGGFGGGTLRIAGHSGEEISVPIGEIEKENPIRHELRLFVEAIRSGGESPIPAEEGRRNVAIAEAAYESAETGRPVTL